MPDDLGRVLGPTRLSSLGDFNNRDHRRGTYKLDEGEHSVMGYFASNHRARQALAQIRDLGFEIAQLDLVARPGADIDSVMAGSPAHAISRNSVIGGAQPYLVTVVTDSEKALAVAKIMEEHGGVV